MFGMLIAVCIVLWNGLMGGSSSLPWEGGVISALGFLWIWYWGWGVFRLIMQALVACGISVGGGAIGGRKAGVLGALGGATLGAAGEALIIALSSIGSVLLIGGVYLIQIAAVPGVAFGQWNTAYLAGGGIVLLIGLLMNRSSLSSSDD